MDLFVLPEKADFTFFCKHQNCAEKDERRNQCNSKFCDRGVVHLINVSKKAIPVSKSDDTEIMDSKLTRIIVRHHPTEDLKSFTTGLFTQTPSNDDANLVRR